MRHRYIDVFKHLRTEKHNLCGFVSTKFQGIGFIIKTDNPRPPDDCIIVEFNFLWLRCWYMYTTKA